MTEITLTENFYGYRVHLNGILHLYVSKPITGMSAWYDDRHTYSIEFSYPTTASIRVEYHTRELWQRVLTEFDKVLR